VERLAVEGAAGKVEVNSFKFAINSAIGDMARFFAGKGACDIDFKLTLSSLDGTLAVGKRGYIHGDLRGICSPFTHAVT